ncbi:MAG: hypothetical protein Fur0021_07080 [Candidatus Promineifilaceae bacterium]
MKNSKRSHILRNGSLGVVVLLLLIQVVPYGRDHANPPVMQEPNWDSPETRALAQVACFDCHSNETVWSWYTNVAPFSWLVQHDVEEGRSKLNFSEWRLTNQHEEEMDEISETLREGEMPPLLYTLIHTNARLSAAEREQLIRSLEATAANALR